MLKNYVIFFYFDFYKTIDDPFFFKDLYFLARSLRLCNFLKLHEHSYKSKVTK